MVDHLKLPPDTTHYLHLLSESELDAVIPSGYELDRLNFVEISKQLVESTLNYQPDVSALSDGLRQNLLFWMLLSSDPRIKDVAKDSSFARNNFIRIEGLTIIDPSNFIGNLKSMELIPARDDENPLFVKSVDLIEKFIKITGEADQFIEFYRQILTNHSFIHNYPVETALIPKVFSAPLTSRPEKSLPLLQVHRHFLEVRGFDYLKSIVGHVEAAVLMFKGQLEDAIQKYETILDYTSQYNVYFGDSVKNNLGIAYYNTGKWDQAIKLYKALLNEYPDDLMYHNNLADTYGRMGEYQKAWKHAKQFLDLSDNLNYLGAFEFVQPILFELGLDEESRKLIERSRRILQESDIPANKAFLLLMEARQARYELNMGLALEYVDKAIDMSMEWNNIALIFNLLVEQVYIYLDLYEIKSTLNNRQKLFNAINLFIQFSDEQAMVSGSIQGLVIRSQIYQMFDELELAKADLYNAVKLADEFNYTNQKERLKSDLQELKIKTDLDEEPTSLLNSIKQKLRQIVSIGGKAEYEEKDFITHGVIVMSHSGLPLYTNYLTDKLKSDSNLISGLISAVSSMLTEVTETHGFLKTIQREDLSLLFEPVDDYLVVSVVSDDNFTARQQLQALSRVTSDLLKDYQISISKSGIPKEFENDMDFNVQKVIY